MGTNHSTPDILFAHDLIRKPVPTFRDHALFLQKPVGRNRDGDLARRRIEEGRQREDAAIDEPADHRDRREKSEQTRHRAPSVAPRRGRIVR